MATIIQLRRDSAENWSSVNPILAEGEQGLETDTGKRKIGDGITAWNDLSYEYGNIPPGGTTGQVLKKNSSTDYDTSWQNESGGGFSAWGNITGDITDQTDLVSFVSSETADGDTAFSWGNHADAGYLQSVSWGDVSGKPVDITLMGNDFNGVNQLVKLDGSGKLPAVDGSQLTNLPSGGASDNYAVATGTNTYSVTIPGLVLAEGNSIRVKFPNANTGASTLNVNGTVLNMRYKGPSTALPAGAISAGQVLELYFDGTVLQLVSDTHISLPNTPNSVITTDGAGVAQTIYPLIDQFTGTTTIAQLDAADWASKTVALTGSAGEERLGTNYLYKCCTDNNWVRLALV